MEETSKTLNDDANRPISVRLSPGFILASFVLPCIAAFFAGRTTGALFLPVGVPHYRPVVNLPDGSDSEMLTTETLTSSEGSSVSSTLPVPVVPKDKDVPQTVFTSKNFAVDNVRTSNTMHLQRDEQQKAGEESSDMATTEGQLDDAVYEPAGQHLLVDIKNVDASFLDSEQLLAEAMVKLVQESGLTLLSYHCHSMIPSGVSCVGILLESHISFHTWPQEGVITLDLFTCGSKPLIPSMPLIEELFGVPRQYQDREEDEEAFEKPRLLWIHKMRGFRKKIHALEEDIGWNVVHHGEFEYKREIASTNTKFQSIQIYDYIDPRFNTLLDYESSISNSTSYQSSNKDLYLPNRAVFLDGVLQSTRKCDEAYHEILVHPAMFTHPNPRRVAIIGGGEGATLREVLKHETVETATMIEIDDDMMKFSREHLPSWSDCSDIIGSRESCFDDPRAEIYALDAMEWFMYNFDDPEGPSEEKYDVIIMDALDPQEDVPFANVLYESKEFWASLYNALNPDGVMVMQLGVSPGIHDAPEEFSKNKLRAELFRSVEDLGFETVHAYEDAHLGFSDSWSFLIVCRGSCRERLFSNEAEVEIQMHKRMKRTKSERHSLQYFDGNTMTLIQKAIPAAWWELECLDYKELPPSCAISLSDPLKWFSMKAILMRKNSNFFKISSNGLKNEFAMKMEKLLADSNEKGYKSDHLFDFFALRRFG